MNPYNLRDRAPAPKHHHTLTRDGLIAHVRLVSADGSLTIEAPVKLLPPRKGEEGVRPMQARDRVGYVYALPGGLEWQA